MAATYFCPHCQSNQPTMESFEGRHLTVRCETCGYPVEEAIVEKDNVSYLRQKILLIDDDNLILKLFSEVLAAHEFVPITATDGPSGLDMAKREYPDLILLDIMMPGLDGYEVCQQMRADPELRETPIIIITAMQDPKLRVKAFKAGATLALQKPLDPQRLINTIKTALALKFKPPTCGR
jgi:CheY-like chemotaxis protein